MHTLPGFSDGPAVDLGDYVGAPLVVNFWATWCGPCVREMPMLRDVSSELSGDVMPTTLLVGTDGVVRYRHTGELTEQKLRALLKEHLAVS